MSNATSSTRSKASKQAKPYNRNEAPENTDSLIHIPRAPWNPAIAVFLAVVVFFGAQIISGIALSFYRYPKHWTTDQLTNWLNNSVSAQFFFILVAETLIIVAVYLFVRRYKDGLRAIGLRRPKWSDPLFGLGALPVYFVSYLLVISIITYLVPSINVNEKQQLGFNSVSGGGQLVMTFISLVVLPPIGEEILFRGLIYSSLKKNLPIVVAVLGTSAIFALGHLPEGGSAGPLYIAAIDTFILSLLLIFLRERTGGLWASMTLHALKNGIAFVLLFAPLAH
jgi:membrane protease YdiL (CAAX protease family)